MAKKTVPAEPTAYHRGSIWRRWDPHVHTPESKLENGFKGWDEYIDALEKRGKDVSVIGITDYYTIDGYKKVLEYRARGRLSQFDMVFPNIEFRTTPELPDGSAINIHLLVSPKDADHVEQIERALLHLRFGYNGTEYGCSRSELIRLGRAFDPKQTSDEGALAQGINLFKPDFTVFSQWFNSQHWLQENALIVIANGKDGPGGLSKDAGFAGVREELYRIADVVFSGNPTDREYFLGMRSDTPEEVKRKNGSLKPCIHGSDAHDMDRLFEPDKNRYCWIKADPTFEGLRQILAEPEDRVYVGPTAPEPTDKSKIIDSVELLDCDEWFDGQKTPLNPALVGIIGEKGSGKTAFAELIAFAANSRTEDEGASSFIKKAAAHLDGLKVRLTWADGRVSEATVPGEEGEDAPEVRYLSQDFVEQLCSQDISGSHLIRQIEEVVFTHIDEADRLDASSFAELKRFKTEHIETRKVEVKSRIAKLNSEIVSLEDQISTRSDKEKQAKKCEADIAAIDKQLPEVQGTVDVEVAKEVVRLEGLLQKKTSALTEANRRLNRVEVTKQDAADYVDNAMQVYEEVKEKLEKAGLKEEEILAFSPNFKGDRNKPFERLKSELQKEIVLLRGDMRTPNPKGESVADLTERLVQERKRLATDEKQRDRLLLLQKQRKQLAAELERLQKEIIKLNGPVAAELEKKRAQRLKTYLSYFKELDEEEKTLEDLYAPLQRVIAEDKTGTKAGFELSVRPIVDGESWLETGLRLLDRRKKAASPIHEKGQVKLLEDGLFKSWENRDVKAIAAGLDALTVSLGGLDDLLLAHVNRRQVYDWLFDTDHVRLEYGLRYDGTDLEVLSPGARGIVLLVLYLAMDTQDTRPLIIDQPEGNLDNASVYKSLVPFLRQAKKMRQIILVTHNPNLVVTTDAEQVIVATAKRSETERHPQIQYQGGSLEDAGTTSATREQAVKLLEGGAEPFMLRENRYDL